MVFDMRGHICFRKINRALS